MNELKPCPWCHCVMRVQSNRDWHKPVGQHSPLCPIEGWEPMYPATDAGLRELIQSWNTRATDAELERLRADLARVTAELDAAVRECEGLRDALESLSDTASNSGWSAKRMRMLARAALAKSGG